MVHVAGFLGPRVRSDRSGDHRGIDAVGDAEERYLRGRIYYAIDSDTSLLPAKSIKDVEVRYRGREKPLDAPRAVTVVLRNGGGGTFPVTPSTARRSAWTLVSRSSNAST